MQDGFAPSINYTAADYERLRATMRKWWGNELGRPVGGVILTGQPSHRAPSPHPVLCFENAWDESISPEHFIDAQNSVFSTMRWKGDAYPWMNFDRFGPGVLAAFLGCTVHARKETVWFEAAKPDIPLSEMHFELDKNNPYLRRVLNVYEAGMEKWRGAVVMSMADLGGVMDILASFRGTENLLFDLYDEPEEVLRCVKEIQREWFKCFDLINSVIDGQMGYSQWFNVYGEKPGYILQSDFSYMISPDMFKTFVAPELDSSAKRLTNALYHLDGPGEIPHLDQLLAMEGVKAIQWMPGPEISGAWDADWSELIARILAGGKKLLTFALTPDGNLNPVIKDPGQVFLGDHHFTDLEEAKRWADRFGIDL